MLEIGLGLGVTFGGNIFIIPPVSTNRVTEDGNNRVTQDANNRVTEGT